MIHHARSPMQVHFDRSLGPGPVVCTLEDRLTAVSNESSTPEYNASKYILFYFVFPQPLNTKDQ